MTFADDGGRYRLDGRIATGGMGEVWRGTDTMLGRPVAVKLLKAEYADDPVFRTRFEAEARHAASLHHPGVASVFDVGEAAPSDGSAVPRPYLVMELVDGQPLSALLRAGRPLDPAAAAALLALAADAIGAAHAAGIVHRDVKPANLLVTPDRRVKITDFGIARAADGIALTQSGQVMGTPAYLSPEQASGKQATAASDVYALGVVAFECLVGRRPFSGDSPITTALAHLREPVPELPPDVPADLARVVRRALAKDPADRFPDGAALAAALRDPAGVGEAGVDPAGVDPAGVGAAGVGAAGVGAAGVGAAGVGAAGDETAVAGAVERVSDPGPAEPAGTRLLTGSDRAGVAVGAVPDAAAPAGPAGPGAAASEAAAPGAPMGPPAERPPATPSPATQPPATVGRGRRGTPWWLPVLLALALVTLGVLLWRQLGADEARPDADATASDSATDAASDTATESDTPTPSPTDSETPTHTDEGGGESEAADSVEVVEDDYLGRDVKDVADELKDLGLKVGKQRLDNPGDQTEDLVASVSPTGTLAVGDSVTVSYWGKAPAGQETGNPGEGTSRGSGGARASSGRAVRRSTGEAGR